MAVTGADTLPFAAPGIKYSTGVQHHVNSRIVPYPLLVCWCVGVLVCS